MRFHPAEAPILCTLLLDARRQPGGPTHAAVLPCNGCSLDVVLPSALARACTAQPGLKRRLVCGRCADRIAREFLDYLRQENPAQYKLVTEQMERQGMRIP